MVALTFGGAALNAAVLVFAVGEVIIWYCIAAINPARHVVDNWKRVDVLRLSWHSRFVERCGGSRGVTATQRIFIVYLNGDKHHHICDAENHHQMPSYNFMSWLKTGLRL